MMIKNIFLFLLMVTSVTAFTYQYDFETASDYNNGISLYYVGFTDVLTFDLYNSTDPRVGRTTAMGTGGGGISDGFDNGLNGSSWNITTRLIGDGTFHSNMGVSINVDDTLGSYGGTGIAVNIRGDSNKVEIYRQIGTGKTLYYQADLPNSNWFSNWINFRFQHLSDGTHRVFYGDSELSPSTNNALTSYNDQFLYNWSLTNQDRGGFYDYLTVKDTEPEPFGVTITYAGLTYSSTPLNITFELLGTPSADCSVENNGSIVQQYTGVGNDAYFLLNDSTWIQGDNNITISCNESLNSDSDMIGIYIDSLNPVYDYVGIVQEDGDAFTINGSNIDDNFNFNISLSNTYLFSFNISIYDTFANGSVNYDDLEYTDKVNDINSSTYVYDKSLNLGDIEHPGEHAFVMEVCDSHTGTFIPDISQKRITDNSLSLGTTKYTVSGDGRFDTIKKFDRYEFDIQKTSKTPYYVDVEDSEQIFIVSRTDYEGHLVHGKRWTDFESDDATVEYMESITPYHVRVRITPSSDDVRFSSTGILNCVNRTDTAFINGEAINFTDISPFNVTYTVNNTAYETEFNFTPQSVEDTDNCTMYIDNGQRYFIDTVTSDVLNTFRINVTQPSPETTRDYTYYYSCEQEHFHPPMLRHEVISISGNYTFSIENIAVAPLTTTPETIGFENTPNALYVLFLVSFWTIFYYMSFRVRGVKGENVGFLNILQLLFGFVGGTVLIRYSVLLGLGIVFICVGTFIGMILYGKA